MKCFRDEREYVFYRRPISQKDLNFDNLRDWYLYILKLGIGMGVFKNYMVSKKTVGYYVRVIK